jgi:hypothetical protein
MDRGSLDEDGYDAISNDDYYDNGIDGGAVTICVDYGQDTDAADVAADKVVVVVVLSSDVFVGGCKRRDGSPVSPFERLTDESCWVRPDTRIRSSDPKARPDLPTRNTHHCSLCCRHLHSIASLQLC